MTLSPVLIQLRRKPVRRISSSLPLLSTARWGCGWGASWPSMVTDFPLKIHCYISLFLTAFCIIFFYCCFTDSDQAFMKYHWQAAVIVIEQFNLILSLPLYCQGLMETEQDPVCLCVMADCTAVSILILSCRCLV